MHLFGVFLFAALIMPDFARDRFLLGHWKCTAQNVYGGRSGTEDAHYALVLGGRWLFLRYVLTPNDGREHVEANAYETFDLNQKKWVYTSFNSLGSYGSTLSDGWSGNSKVYASTKQGRTLRYVVRKISNTELLEESGRSTVHCKKQQR